MVVVVVVVVVVVAVVAVVVVVVGRPTLRPLFRRKSSLSNPCKHLKRGVEMKGNTR